MVEDIPVVLLRLRAALRRQQFGQSHIEQAQGVAGDKVVHLFGATVMQQALPLGLVDEIHVHVVAVLIGAGTPLFGTLDTAIALERTDARVTPAATHLRFRVVR